MRVVGDPEHDAVLLVLERDEDVADALGTLATIGYGNVAGYLVGGVAAWQAAGLPVETLPQMSVHELRERLRDDPTLLVVDVREGDEFVGRRLSRRRPYAVFGPFRSGPRRCPPTVRWR